MTYETVTAKKAAATHNWAAAAVFPQQKITGSVLADPCVLPHLSSSSDSRILSSTQPSQVSPMTDFRQVWHLHAYSGGTVRDSHPVFYSLAVLLPHPQALKWNIYLRIYDTRLWCNCQSNPVVSILILPTTYVFIYQADGRNNLDWLSERYFSVSLILSNIILSLLPFPFILIVRIPRNLTQRHNFLITQRAAEIGGMLFYYLFALNGFLSC